ncbi:MAG: hypothetical protein LBE38_01355 [Deltaproteobacteria bacterium]|jgi:hypothetical protein|nr:hypothetical protein [Deltaproteobacteria bacterium]
MAPSHDDSRIEIFLNALSEGMTVENAKKDSSLNWKLLYLMRKNDKEFRKAWEMALEAGGRKQSRIKPVTKEHLQTFLEALGSGDSVIQAAEKTGISSSSFYKKRMRDPEFKALWKKAYQQRPRRWSRITEEECGIFLKAIREGKLLKDASKEANRHLSCFYRLKRHDIDFSIEWQRARMERMKRKHMGAGIKVQPSPRQTRIILTTERKEEDGHTELAKGPPKGKINTDS